MARFTPAQRSILSASLTLSAAVGVFSIAYGVLAVSAGASIAQTCALSLFTFTGASQLSAVGVIATGGSASAAVGGALLLAARNAVYGLALAPYFTGSLGRRLVTAQFVIDETTAMMTAQGEPRHRQFAFWWTALPLFSMWNLGTLLGALLGSAIDPQAFGLDVAFSAAFVAMLAPHLTHVRGRQAAALGALICLALIPFVPVGVPILAAGLAIFIGVRPHEATV
ncbi:MAG: AzlC family ABC transporter permease [Actinomycetota bacterium]